MKHINLVAFFGFLLLSHLVHTSTADTALLRGRKTEVADIVKVVLDLNFFLKHEGFSRGKWAREKP